MQKGSMAVVEWGRRHAAPMSLPTPHYAKASFLINPAEFREKNRLPAVYRKSRGINPQE